MEHPIPANAGSEAGGRHTKAVMASEFMNWATGEGIATGLRSSGWLIEEVNPKNFFPSGSGRTIKVVRKLLGPLSRRSFNAAIIKSCHDVFANALIAVKGSNIFPRTIETLKSESILTVIFYPDAHFDFPDVNLDVIRDVDVLITTKAFQLDWLRELRGQRSTHLVHHGYPGGIVLSDHSLSDEAYDYDLAYAGNPDSHKLALLAQVASAFPDRKIVVAGNNWTTAAAGTPLEPYVMRHPLTGDFLADLHRRTRINLAIHMGPQPNGWADRVSTRTFEIPAFRGFMLHVDNDEVRSLYDVPSEIDVFIGSDDLIEKIGYYLDRPDLRRQMIERAHRRAVPAYSYHARGVAIDALLRPLLSGRRPER